MGRRKKKSKGLPIVGQGSLRPAAPAKTLAESPMGRRRAFVLIGVHLLIIGHIVHWRMTGSTLSPVEPSEAMELSKHGVVNTGAVFFAAAVLSTLVFGRFFCGWGCHILALQDLCGHWLQKMGIRPTPFKSKILIWVPPLAFIYMFLWPVAYRIWIGDSLGIKGVELTTEDFWATFPAWPVALLTFFVCGFVIVYFLGQKGFCTYACPYGGIFGFADKLSPLRIRVNDDCSSCGHCTAVCTSNVRVHEEVRDYGSVVDPGCMKCLDCVSVCPNDALSLSWGAPAVLTRPRVETVTERKPAVAAGEELILAVAFIAALFTFRGLYGLFPFLLSLGLSAILAFNVLLLFRLIRRPNLRLRRFQLKKSGALTRSGVGFVAVQILVLALWGHSAVLQWNQFRGSQSYAEISDLRTEVLTPEARGWELSSEERTELETAVDRFGRAADLALVPQPMLELRLTWMNLLLDREGEFERRAQRALDLGADPSVLHALSARRYIRQGRWNEAAQEYERAVIADPSSLQPHLGLGMLLAGLGDLENASAAFERGLGHLPEEADLYYNAGLSSALSGNVETAIQRFGEALDRNPSHLAARENLAGVLAGVGRYRESVDHYLEAVRQAPSDAETRLLLARVYIALGELDRAETQVRQALDLDPSSIEARELLGRIAPKD